MAEEHKLEATEAKEGEEHKLQGAKAKGDEEHPLKATKAKGDEEHPLKAIKAKGAGVLPVCLIRGELFCLFQHEIRGREKPKNEKAVTFIDFGGKTDKEEDVFSTAARELFEEVPVHAEKLLLPYGEEGKDAAGLAKVLHNCPYRVNKGKGTSYVCFLLPVAFVPTCLLAERLTDLDYKKDSKAKIRTYWWLPFSGMTDRRLAIHSRLKIPGLSKSLAKLAKQSEVLLKEKAERCDVQALLSDKTAMKNVVRRMVWESMDECGDVLFPVPCFGRIPNFCGSELAGQQLVGSQQFKDATVVKVNPSLAQEPLRYYVMRAGKTLMTPSPALEAFFMYLLEPEGLRSDAEKRKAAKKEGAMVMGRGLRVASWPQPSPHIDLLVVASVAVCPFTGARIGKGLGFGEIEWAILHELGAISEKTVLATTVSESQLVYDLPTELLAPHDMRVDLIATPWRLIEVPRMDGVQRKPPALDWSLLDDQLINATPALREMRVRGKEN